ncbi:MAG: glycosyltransferase family 2 protein [Bacteroidia bacterium]|nr:glycosyltransferase family 2 protein [Bacteroidia bacterium]
MTPVTAVILNWNGAALLEQFLPSVVASTYPALEVLVADNGSTDTSLDLLHTRFPQVRTLALDQNYGFAEGNNRAIPHVTTPYVALVNSDVAVSPGWLEPLAAYLDTHPEAAAVQPAIRAWHAQDQFEYAGAAGGWMDLLGYPFCRGRIFDTVEHDQGQYPDTMPVFWATGACCLVRMEVIREIGLFDAAFFAHMEEIDFCWRARNRGYEIACVPASVVWHVGGGTLARANPRKTYLNARNSLICLLKNLPAPQLMFIFLARLLLDGVWAARALVQRDWQTPVAILRAHWAVFGRLGYWLRQRRTLHASGTPRWPLTGVYQGSIVWAYFLRGHKTWREVFDPSPR